MRKRIPLSALLLSTVSIIAAYGQTTLHTVGDIINTTDTLILTDAVVEASLPTLTLASDNDITAITLDTLTAQPINAQYIIARLHELVDEEGEWIPINIATVCERGHIYSAATILPYIYVDNQWLVATQYTVSEEPRSDVQNKALKSTENFTTSSALASGNWIKVGVTSSGIKKLTSSTLASWGFSDISKVSVYGTGGTELPLANSDDRVDDLAQLPVYRGSGYILFYAEGIETWSYTTSQKSFTAAIHPMAEQAYYFITDSGTPSPSVEEEADTTVTTKATITQYDARATHRLRSKNLLSSGRDWWGEEFSPTTNSHSISLDLPPRTATTDEVKVSVRMAGRSASAIAYTIDFNGDEIGNSTISAVSSMSSGTGDYAKSTTRNLTTTSSNLTDNIVTVTMTFTSTVDLGWIDYVTVCSKAALDIDGADELLFRNRATYSNSGYALYKVEGATSSTLIWDITTPTAPTQKPVTLSGTIAQFKHPRGSTSEFVAFDPSGSFETPTYIESVSNQNLHGLSSVDYAIITNPDFLEQAEELAEIHRQYSDISVVVVTTEQIYNEFSGGKREAKAIRDFLRMLYQRGAAGDGDPLQYALLFGDGSYDNRTYGSDNPGNKVPTYQSSASINYTNTYCTDDFFGWLDDTEGSSDLAARMDIGIGRFPVQTVAQAQICVNKTRTYLTGLDQGAWKSRVAFASDDDDDNEHLDYAEQLASQVEEAYPEMIIKRIFLEAYQSQSTSTGITYPFANSDFETAVNEGSLVVNYVGHGGHDALTDQKLFKQAYIQEYTNTTRLPFFITATCDFGPFDEYDLSAGEECLVYEYGGFIGLFTTTRLVYSDSNYKINAALWQRLFEIEDNYKLYTVGEASRYAKCTAGGLVNSVKYILLGDPAIRLAKCNELTVSTDSVNGIAFADCDEPVSALAVNTISGSIRTADGDIDTSFNGEVEISLYDKRSVTSTLGEVSAVYTYEEYKSVIFNGTVEVTDGQFTVSIILSKDIDLEEGYGRITYFASADNGDEAQGYSNEILVGGISVTDEVDTIGPTIIPWFDYDDPTRTMYYTGCCPVLYATISDPSGINTSGSGIGHDISLIVDEDRVNAITVNDYFSYNAGSYTTGTLEYQLSNLDEGDHTLTIKAWDNWNNASDTTIVFNVTNYAPISFGKTELYPSPLHNGTEHLKLRFSHNDGGRSLELTIHIFSIDGRRMAKQSITLVASDTQTDEIDLTDAIDIVASLSSGLYVVQVDVVSSSGRKGDFSKKLMVAAQ